MTVLFRFRLPVVPAPRRFAANPDDPAWMELQRIADQLSPDLRDAFLAAINQLSSQIDLTALVQALEAQQPTQAENVIPYAVFEEALRSKVRPVLENLISQAADATARDLAPDVGTTLRFDLTNPQAVAWIDEHAAELVRQVSDETRLAIRGLIRTSFEQGVTPAETARLIRQRIGLTAQGETAVENYRTFLQGLGQRDSLANLPESVYARLGRGGLRRNQRGTLARQGLATGKIEQLVRGYRQRLISERAMTIARTETLRAANQGQQMLWEQAAQAGLIDAGAVRRVWIATPSERTCSYCIAMDGKTVGLVDQFNTGLGPTLTPPAHPRCLPGNSCVSPGGRVTAASKRWYDGDLLIIRTSSGNQLSCTPNHPILTPSGWVAACFLNEGGHVISSSSREWMAVGRSHDDNMPAKIKDIAEAFGCSEQVVSMPVPVAPEDFHGDGFGSEVAVIWSNGLLVDDFDFTITEHVREFPFSRRNVQLPILVGAGTPLTLFQRGNPSLGRIVSSLDLGFSLFRRHLCPLHAFGLAAITWSKSQSQQATLNSPTINPEVFSKSIDGHPRIEMATKFVKGNIDLHRPRWTHLNAGRMQAIRDDDLADTELIREILAGAAGPVFLDEIVDIERVAFHGHVYNLQTETGWYAAEGMITHNCRCAIGLDFGGR